jgi:hypothetical protein
MQGSKEQRALKARKAVATPALQHDDTLGAVETSWIGVPVMIDFDYGGRWS